MLDLKTNAAELKKRIPDLEKDLSDPITFRKIYQFSFDYSKETPEVRSVDLDTAKVMLPLLLKDKFPIVEKFCEFLGVCW